MKDPVLVVLAAGMGSRYGGMKQIDPVGPNGQLIIDYSIYDARRAGFKKVIFIIKHAIEDAFKEAIGNRLSKIMDVDYAYQEIDDLPEGYTVPEGRTKPWGTSHAVLAARDIVDGPFAVINADDYYGKPAFKYAARFIADSNNRDAYGLMAYTLKDTLSEHGSVSRGVCQVEGSRLLSVKERTKIEQRDGVLKDWDSGVEFTGNESVSMNFWVCNPSLFQNIEKDFRTFLKSDDNVRNSEIYLPFVIQEMIENNSAKVVVIPSGSKWFGVTYTSDKEVAVNELQGMTDNGEYPSPLWPNSK